MRCWSRSISARADDAERIRDITAALVPATADAPARTLGQRMAALHVPGVSIAFLRDGRVAWAQGFGVAWSGGPAVTPDTRFQAGSISKPVTAMGVLALVQGGRLSLDGDANDALRGWKIPASPLTEGTPVTLRALLGHVAGFNVHGFPGYAAGAAVPSLVQVLDGAPPANTEPVRVVLRPGTRFRYSGGGYSVVQQMVVDVTGQPFAEVMQQRVLGPLGMGESCFCAPEAGAVAAVPSLESGDPVPGGAHVYPELAAAGLWTTASDLARFALAVQDAAAGRDARVLTQASAQAMLTPGLGRYGLGLMLRGPPGNRAFLHDGVDYGFTALMVAGETGEGVVVMTNGWSEGLAGEVVVAVARAYGWPRRR